jgi:hypothetical protein
VLLNAHHPKSPPAALEQPAAAVHGPCPITGSPVGRGRDWRPRRCRASPGEGCGAACQTEPNRPGVLVTSEERKLSAGELGEFTIGGLATWVAVGSTSIRLNDIRCTRHGAASRPSADPVAAARIAGQLPPCPARGPRDRQPVGSRAGCPRVRSQCGSPCSPTCRCSSSTSTASHRSTRTIGAGGSDTMSPTAGTARHVGRPPPGLPTRRTLMCTEPSSWRTGCWNRSG